MRGWLAIVGAMMVVPAGAAMTADQLDRLQASANSGNADSAFRLGRAYKIGDDVPADLDKAEHWFARAAKLGNPRAGAELGLVLAQNGKGAAAMPWLTAAAEKGDARAQYALGALLYGGQGVAVDATRGRDWMRKAANSGLPAAVEALAVMDKALAPSKAPPRPYQVVTIDMNAPVAAKVVDVKPMAKRGENEGGAAPRGQVWRVQLGTFAVPGNAQRYWQAVKASVPPPLRATFPVNGGLTRVLVGPFPGREAASRFCEAQRKRQRACLEVKGG